MGLWSLGSAGLVVYNIGLAQFILWAREAAGISGTFEILQLISYIASNGSQKSTQSMNT